MMITRGAAASEASLAPGWRRILPDRQSSCADNNADNEKRPGVIRAVFLECLPELDRLGFGGALEDAAKAGDDFEFFLGDPHCFFDLLCGVF